MSDRPPPPIGHAAFIEAHRTRRLHVVVDPNRAARHLSARLMLPLVMMPVIGIGIALALTGSAWTGLLVIGGGIIVPRMIKRSAPDFLLRQALQDAQVYEELIGAGVMSAEIREPA